MVHASVVEQHKTPLNQHLNKVGLVKPHHVVFQKRL